MFSAIWQVDVDIETSRNVEDTKQTVPSPHIFSEGFSRLTKTQGKQIINLWESPL